MKRIEYTSARVARIAAKVMKMRMRWYREILHPNDRYTTIEPALWADIRALAASCLTQTAGKPKPFNVGDRLKWDGQIWECKLAGPKRKRRTP